MSVFLNNITFNARGWNFLLQSENSMTQPDYMEKAHPTAMNVQWQLGAFGQDLPNWVVMMGGYFTSHSTLLILK